MTGAKTYHALETYGWEGEGERRRKRTGRRGGERIKKNRSAQWGLYWTFPMNVVPVWLHRSTLVFVCTLSIAHLTKTFVALRIWVNPLLRYRDPGPRFVLSADCWMKRVFCFRTTSGAWGRGWGEGVRLENNRHRDQTLLSPVVIPVTATFLL